MTRFGDIRNEDTRDRYGVAPIVEKLREGRLPCYGHINRANENSLAIGAIDAIWSEHRSRSKGRPKQRWLDTLDGDLKATLFVIETKAEKKEEGKEE